MDETIGETFGTMSNPDSEPFECELSADERRLKNQRAIALLRRWCSEPQRLDSQGIIKELRRSLDSSRPHRPLFEGLRISL